MTIIILHNVITNVNITFPYLSTLCCIECLLCFKKTKLFSTSALKTRIIQHAVLFIQLYDKNIWFCETIYPFFHNSPFSLTIILFCTKQIPFSFCSKLQRFAHFNLFLWLLLTIWATPP
eukprot:UN03444